MYYYLLQYLYNKKFIKINKNIKNYLYFKIILTKKMIFYL